MDTSAIRYSKLVLPETFLNSSKIYDECRFKTACQIPLTRYIWKTYELVEKWG